MYFIGIDGGGTKTKCVCYDDNGRELDQIILPTCHILQVGQEGMVKILSQGLNYFKAKFDLSHDVYIGLGLAGYGRDMKIRQQIEQACQEAFEGFDFKIDSDAKIALLGALNQEDGMLVIAGTGSIVLGKVKGKEYRCGGWGPIIGDDGSGYTIGREVLNLYSKQSDGRMEKTALYDIVKVNEKIEDDAMLPAMAVKFSREKIASFAYYALEGAKQHDPHCLDLYKKAANELALMIHALLKYYDQEKVYVSYAGGVFNGKDYIISPLKDCLDSRICLIDPMNQPEYGAYLLALELYKEKKDN